MQKLNYSVFNILSCAVLHWDKVVSFFSNVTEDHDYSLRLILLVDWDVPSSPQL